VGAETAAPVARAPGRRRGTSRRGTHDGGGAPAPEPHVSNRAQLALLSRLGPVMRSCACEEPAVSRCACGCGGKCEEDVSVARQAAPGAAPGGGGGSALAGAAAVVSRPGRALDGRTRGRMERSFGRDFGGVRIHTDTPAASSARRLGARAYTVGDHIVFGAGQYAPDHRAGQHLLAHELAHTVQQRDHRHVQRAGTVSRPSDPHEREAEAVATAVIAGRTVSPAQRAPAGTVSRGLLDDAIAGAGSALDEAGELVEDVVESGAELVEDVVEVAGDVVEGVQAAWDLAHEIGAALGGSVSVSGCGITIAVPSVAVDASLTLPVSLPGASFSLPLAIGLFPIAGIVNAYGVVYLNLSVVPTLEVQLGPGSLNGGAIVIDWCTPTYGGAVSFTYTLAAALGAELRGGIGGQVGLEVNVPVPPVVIPVPIPLASVDVGVVGALLGTGVTTVTQALSLFYSGGTLAYSDHSHTDVGLKLSAGIGAFGALTALGFNICTLYWPLFAKAWEDTWTVDRALDVAISSGGFSVIYGAAVSRPPGLTFSDFPVHLTTDVLTDDCLPLDAICRVLYALGWMPSQDGGVWDPGAIPPWPGPLPDVFPRTPGIASGSLCRGACGPNCRMCEHLGPKAICIPEEGNRHSWIVYPEFEDCATHDGCRQHDACYDWCSVGASAFDAFLCRRLCDLECMCAHSPGQCFGWIFGIGGDAGMFFSEAPVSKPGCLGSCPEEKTDEAGVASLELCLPPIELTDALVIEKSFGDSTGDVVIFSKIVPLPVVGGVPLTVTARGDLDASGFASLEPIRLERVCLIVDTTDPAGPTYTGTAELHIPAQLDGQLILTGTVAGILGIPCLALAKAEGGLEATAFVNDLLELTDRVSVVCEMGEIDLVNQAFLTNDLQIGFSLDAFLRLFLLGFKLWSETWNLVDFVFDKSWEWEIAVLNRRTTLGAFEPDLHLGDLSAADFLTFLLQDQPEPAAAQAADDPGSIFNIIGALCPGSGEPAPEDPECDTPALPVTLVTFTGTDRGEKVIAEPLTRCPGNTRGSRPSARVFRNVRDQCIPKKDAHEWVAAHLLHGPSGRGGPNLHGPGKEPNLILTDGSLNRQMLLQVEEPAIAATQRNEVLFYEVTAEHFDNSGHKRFFGERMRMKWGKLKPDGTREPTPILDKPVESERKLQPPDCPNFKP
jgi:hypothetical protein